MPVRRVGKGCYQWGHHGARYCGPGARQKAERQGRAAYAHGYRGMRETQYQTLWRAAVDDYVDTGYSFAEKRSIAEAYLDNPGFGGANIYRTKIEVDKNQVLDLTEKSVGEVARMLGVQHPGAIGLDEWLPRSPRILDALHEDGYLWVLVSESFPNDTTTWIWIGTGADNEPELELWDSTAEMQEVDKQQITLTDFELKLLDAFSEEIGAPASYVAKELDVSTAKVTTVAKKLATEGLLEDTGYAMKYMSRSANWQYIDRPKTEGGMTSRPGASTVWRTTPKGLKFIE